MKRKSFIKPFAASIVTLLAGVQANAAVDHNFTDSVVRAAKDATPAVDDGLILARPEATGPQLAMHASHSSHSSHSSHASHSSHSSHSSSAY